jgi:PAS domain S-box-containing protein
VFQDALKISEIRYRRLFETAQDAILILDGDTGEIIDANAFILDMLGYPLEYCIGKHLWELGFIKDKSIAQHTFAELKSKGYIRYEDLPLETKDGRSIDVDFISHVYLAGDKKIFQCNIRDITARRHVRDALVVSEAQYRTLFEYSSDAIFIMNSTVILDCNHSAEVMYGCSRDQIIGTSPAALSPKRQPDGGLSIEKAKEKIDTALSGEPQFFEWVQTRYDHTTFNAEVTLIRIVLEGDSCLQVIVREIPNSRQEEALNELGVFNRSFIEVSIDPFVTITCDGKIQDVNTATEKVTGIPRNKLIGTDFSECCTEPEKVREEYSQIFSRGKVIDYPLEIRHSDGHTIPVRCNATVYRGSDGKIKGVFAAVREIPD